VKHSDRARFAGSFVAAPAALASLAAIIALAAPPTRGAEWDGEPWADYTDFLSVITPAVEANVKAIAMAGHARGRELGRMGQIGDSITESAAFFRNVLLYGPSGNATGHDYEPVCSWLAYGGAQPADSNSFYADHGKGAAYGNLGGWTLGGAASAGHPTACVEVGDGVTPGNFSWALVMFGTNDIDDGGWESSVWKVAYKDFVEELVDLGVVPVLSTIPPEQAHVGDGRVEEANARVVEIADELAVPYVDFCALILHYQPGTWLGTLISADGTHPSAGGGGQDFSENGLTTTDGYAARTKLALDVAERLEEIFSEALGVEKASWGRLKGRYRK
jgi:hypothetical protein